MKNGVALVQYRQDIFKERTISNKGEYKAGNLRGKR